MLFFLPLTIEVSDYLLSLLDVFYSVSFRYHDLLIYISDKVKAWMCHSVIQRIVFYVRLLYIYTVKSKFNYEL